MPYFIDDQHPDCENWAVVKDDGELVACHDSRESAIEQMVAISQAEGVEVGGTYTRSQRAAPDELEVGDFVRWQSSGGTAQGRITRIVRDGQISVPDSDFTINGEPDDPAALIRIYRETEEGWQAQDQQVGHRFSTLTKIADLRSLPDLDSIDPCKDCDDECGVCTQKRYIEIRQVNLDPPTYMRAAARQGLRYYEEGLAGDGLTPRTVREARAMARGSMTADKWVRLRAWISRHLVDLDAPAANPNNEDYPSAGVVAHLLWGSGPSKSAARRTLEYADRIVARLEEENRTLTTIRGEAMAKIEHRNFTHPIEMRDDGDGMTFTGYAAVFNSPSEPLPFTERIAQGAFQRSLKRARNDIKLLWNHDTGTVLGSTRAGTLKLEEDATGLKVTASLPPTTAGRDASVLLKRGDIDSMSFGFSVPAGGDSWNDDGSERTLNSVRLHEVSIVAFPAYSETAGKTAVRGLDLIAERSEVDADALADAMLKLEEGKDLSSDEANMLRTVIDQLNPEQVAEEAEPEAPQGDLGMLALKKAKYNLLKGN